MVLGQVTNALNNMDMQNLLFAVVLLVVAIMAYNYMSSTEGMGNYAELDDELDAALRQQGSESMVSVENAPMGIPSDVGGMDVSGLIRDNRELPQFADTTLNADELLPAQDDERFLQLHPRGGAGKLSGRNFLASKPHFGIDTQGSSLRNANLQLRSEPANPIIANLTPFSNSTIDPSDSMRKSLEIGSAPSQSWSLPTF